MGLARVVVTQIIERDIDNEPVNWPQVLHRIGLPGGIPSLYDMPGRHPHVRGSFQALCCYPEGATGVQGTMHADTVG